MRREERVTVQGPVKEQQPDGMSHRGSGWVKSWVGGSKVGWVGLVQNTPPLLQTKPGEGHREVPGVDCEGTLPRVHNFWVDGLPIYHAQNNAHLLIIRRASHILTHIQPSRHFRSSHCVQEAVPAGARRRDWYRKTTRSATPMGGLPREVFVCTQPQLSLQFLGLRIVFHTHNQRSQHPDSRQRSLAATQI